MSSFKQDDGLDNNLYKLLQTAGNTGSRGSGVTAAPPTAEGLQLQSNTNLQNEAIEKKQKKTFCCLVGSVIFMYVMRKMV